VPRVGVRISIRNVGAASVLAWRAAPGCVALQVLLSLTGGLAPVAAAWLTKGVLDQLTGPNVTLAALLPLAGGLVAVGVVLGVVPHTAAYANAQLERQVGRLARSRLYEAVNALPGLARLEDPEFQDRLQLAEQASRAGPGQLVTGALGGAQSVVTLSGFLVTLVVLSPLTAVLVVLAAVPVFLVHLALSREQAATVWRTGHGQRREAFFARLLGTPHAANEVRLFGLGDFFRGRMLSEMGAVHDEQRRVARRQLRAHGWLAVLSAGVAGVGLVWVIAEAAAGRVTVGGVSVFAAAVAGVQAALAGGVQSAASAHQALLLFDHYRVVLATPPDLPRPARPEPVPVLRRGIELRDVWFRYSPGHAWVLRGVDLFIPYGQAVGLVGLNGAGKSTLVKLLCRFYDPTRENVGVGDLSALADLTTRGDRTRIESAARNAGAHDVLDRLPLGYHTLLTKIFFRGTPDDDPQTGVQLSGGQWQRVALARALLRERRDLMILDEPSAGLDAQAEHEVHATLRAFRAGRTSVLISHRLSAVRDADLIVVLADGRVVEQGRHAALTASGGRYAELFELQASGYLDPSAGPSPAAPAARR